MTYKIDRLVRKIKCPVICKTEDTQIEFDNGEQAAEYSFDKYYLVDAIDLIGGKMIIHLVENKRLNDMNWVGEETVSVFDGA